MSRAKCQSLSQPTRCSSFLPAGGGMARLSIPGAIVCKFPAHRKYAVAHLSGMWFEPRTSRLRIKRAATRPLRHTEQDLASCIEKHQSSECEKRLKTSLTTAHSFTCHQTEATLHLNFSRSWHWNYLARFVQGHRSVVPRVLDGKEAKYVNLDAQRLWKTLNIREIKKFLEELFCEAWNW